MPKLDVGVGDEFPAKEVREDPEEEPVVHHHHYYRRRYYGRPGRWLFFVLWIMVLSLVFRLLDFVFVPPGAVWHWNGGWAGLKGALYGILIIAGLIWFARWRREEDERDAERRDDRRPGDGR